MLSILHSFKPGAGRKAAPASFCPEETMNTSKMAWVGLTAVIVGSLALGAVADDTASKKDYVEARIYVQDDIRLICLPTEEHPQMLKCEPTTPVGPWKLCYDAGVGEPMYCGTPGVKPDEEKVGA